MTNVEEIRRELNDAKVQLQEAKDEVTAFKDGADEQWLTELNRKLRGNEGTEAQRAEWKEERDKLEKRQERLDKAKEDRLKHVQELQLRLTSAETTAQSGVEQIAAEPGSRKRKREDEQAELITNILNMAAPSTSSKVKYVREIQKNSDNLYIGRPANRVGPPVALYHPVFGEFMRDFENESMQISDNVAKVTMEVIDAAQEFYGSENDRVQAMNQPLSKIFGAMPRILNADNSEIDAIVSMQPDGLNQEAALAVIEYKNEIGTGWSDPTIQGDIAFARYWSQNEHNDIRRRCCCPSFVIGIAGPWICIIGAVFLNNMVAAEPLTDFISMTHRAQNNKRVRLIARLLESMKCGFERLRGYYNSVKNFQPNNEARFFPYLQHFKSSSNIVQFVYTDKLIKDPTKTLWLANTQDGEKIVKIVIKYVERYCEDAHRLCASENLAPQLLYVGPRMPGGYQMIAMEYIEGTTLYNFSKRDPATTTSIYEDLEKAITQVLHPRELVFADLRSPNILVVTRDGKYRAMLVDFDWCGKDGIDTYPSSMNMDQITWPERVIPGIVLKKEDDKFMLEKLKYSLNL